MAIEKEQIASNIKGSNKTIKPTKLGGTINYVRYMEGRDTRLISSNLVTKGKASADGDMVRGEALAHEASSLHECR